MISGAKPTKDVSVRIPVDRVHKLPDGGEDNSTRRKSGRSGNIELKIKIRIALTSSTTKMTKTDPPKYQISTSRQLKNWRRRRSMKSSRPFRRLHRRRTSTRASRTSIGTRIKFSEASHGLRGGSRHLKRCRPVRLSLLRGRRHQGDRLDLWRAIGWVKNASFGRRLHQWPRKASRGRIALSKSWPKRSRTSRQPSIFSGNIQRYSIMADTANIDGYNIKADCAATASQREEVLQSHEATRFWCPLPRSLLCFKMLGSGRNKKRK